MQATIARSVSLSGIGLHGGKPARVTLRPAPVGAGIVFHRIDVVDRDQVVPARHDAVVDTRLCTVIGNAAGATVATIEHVMAAVAAAGIDNLAIDIDGPEVPIMDGSAAHFAVAIAEAGLAYADSPRRALRVLAPVSVMRGDATASIAPAEHSSVSFEIDFPDAAIGRQRIALDITPSAFSRELADCRTFARRDEIDRLRAAGLGLGGGLHNAVVVDGARVLNPGGLRRPDEFVRHKALDAVGDLALAGAPVLGAYRGERAGHALTNELLRKLFATPGAWRWEAAPPRPELVLEQAAGASRLAAE